jgi:bifunctional non-homologous end joining protein LigD
MSLQVYAKKRNFKNTPEPAGNAFMSKSKLAFVVHRHKASHLHYDLRLEMDGVLKSWAVPKGPSLNPKDKRLAMMVEDHPYSYKNFEGIIPEGNYGAGIVEIWDEGYLSDIENSEKKIAEKELRSGLKHGNLKFRLHGKKLNGEFVLVKLNGKSENAWLLIKHNDEFAVKEAYNSEAHTPKNSPINKWLIKNKKNNSSPGNVSNVEQKSDNTEENKNAEEEAVFIKRKHNQYLPVETKKLNNFIKPMLAKETDEPFSSKDWIYEIKWDGYRAIAEINKNSVSLYSRNGNTFNASYPIVVNALQKLNINAVIDGEIVVMDKNGKSDFQLLQHYSINNKHPMQFQVFDVLSINAKNTCGLPLIERKKILKQVLNKKNDVIKYSDHIVEKGNEFFKIAAKNDLEGIVAKKADSFYYPGIRTNEWLKIKHHKTLEAIIAGFTQPAGSRKKFGALILGTWNKNKLEYIGHTGTGFNEKKLQEMSKLFKPLIQKKSPFDELFKTNTPATWLKPVLVCEIKYTEWTNDGHLRHPVFLRLRDDKKANEITMDAIKPIKKEAIKEDPIKTKKKNSKERSYISENQNEKTISFGKIDVKITNVQKIFWPEEEITKGDVVNYYQSIAKYILPYLKDRPESLYRNPNGINEKGFYHKDAGDDAPDWIDSYKIFSSSVNKNINYIICNKEATLAYLNNLACIEFNPWHSTIKELDKPDYLIIDIDPSEKNTFEQVIETANVIHDILKSIGADSYCKTSGATGIHVYVPTQKKYTYDQLKDFAHLICMYTQEQLPNFTSLDRNLKKRGNKMIYLDHLQNRRGQTIASVYSLRPRKGATVSMPLKWKEVKYGLSPQDFNIYNSLKRIEKKGDLFSGVLGKGIDLEKCLNLLEKQKHKSYSFA